jgi:hypothetical protein
MRKALNLRDRRCQEPGCQVPAAGCEPHHVLHWADWHRTELGSLRLYCPVHHRRRHPENHRFSEASARAAACLRAPP